MNTKVKILAFSTVAACFSFEVGAQSGEMQDARDALQLINHINCAVAEITESKDPIVLEREYNALTVDSLKLDSIKDEFTIATITSLMRTAAKMRINAVEREMLMEEIEAETNEAIYQAMPNIGSLASPNLLSTAVNLTIGAASAYVNFEKQRKAIERRAKKENWALDKEKIEALEIFNEDLLEAHWSIIKNYGINDYKRVTSKDIKAIIEHFRDPDKRRRWAFFKLHTDEYKFSTRFWYYRSVAAEAVGDYLEAEMSLDEYQKIHLQISRKDKIAALVAMQKVRYLIDRDQSEPAVRAQLKIVEENAELDDWNLFYFCGLVYADKLNDVEMAKNCLNKAITQLSFRLDKRLSEFNGKLNNSEYNEKDHGKIPSAESLMACRMQLQRIERREGNDDNVKRLMLDVINKENSLMLDAVYYIGRTRDTEVISAIGPKLTTISIEAETRWGRQDAYTVVMPIEWFEAGEVKPMLRFGKDTDGGFVLSEPKRELVRMKPRKVYPVKKIALTSAALACGGIVGDFVVAAGVGMAAVDMDTLKPYYESRCGAFVRLTFRTEIDKLDANLTETVLEIPHKYCDVKIVFSLPRDKKNRHTTGFAIPKEIVVDGNSFGLEIVK